MAGVRDAQSMIVKIEWILNWLTFVFARFTSHVLITIKLLQDSPKFGKGVELPLAFLGMLGMNFLNIFLGIDLFEAHKRKTRSQTQNDHSNHHE